MTSVDPVEPSRRERKKLQTRQSLRTHALRLFAERGFDATTVHDITDAADLSPRTFFLHYAAKEEVLLGNGRAGVAQFEQLLHARPAGEDPFSSVRAATVGALATDETSREEFTLQARLLNEAPHLLGRIADHYAEYEDIITSSVASRYDLDPRVDAYPRLLAACAMTAVRVGLSLWHRRGCVGPLGAVVDELFDELSSGFAFDRPRPSTTP